MSVRRARTRTDDSLPAVVDLARTIAGQDEPDEKTMAIAHATHARLTASRLKTAPPCSSCRHHTVFSRSVPVLRCMHPAIANITRNVAEGYSMISSTNCKIEREEGERSSYGTVLLCGPHGLLHEPLTWPWLMPRTRALLRKRIAQR